MANGSMNPVHYDIKTPQPYTAPDYAVIKLIDNKVMGSTGQVLFDFNNVPVEIVNLSSHFTDYSTLNQNLNL